MKAATIVLLILLAPVALFAAPTIGVYANNSTSLMMFGPPPYSTFTGYVFGVGLNCFTNAVEFAVQLPEGIVMTGWSIPYENSLTLGDPLAGLAVTYWPPLSTFDPGYNLLAQIQLMALPTGACLYYGGTSPFNAPLRIVNHPASGALRQSCWPDNNLVNLTGLVSIICPEEIATEETSWGAIKSLF